MNEAISKIPATWAIKVAEELLAEFDIMTKWYPDENNAVFTPSVEYVASVIWVKYQEAHRDVHGFVPMR